MNKRTLVLAMIAVFFAFSGIAFLATSEWSYASPQSTTAIGDAQNLGSSAPARPAEKSPKESAKSLSRSQIIRLLSVNLDVTPLQRPVALKDVIDWIHAEVDNIKGVKLSITANTQAFRNEDPDAPDIFETRLTLPPNSKTMTVRQLLRVVLAQIPTQNATYIIRGGQLEITTVQQTSSASLANEKVTAVFDKCSLEEVATVLSEQTGVSIIIDPRLGARVKTPVTATFANNVSLQVALAIATNLAEAEAVLLRDVFLITTQENARKIEGVEEKLLESPIGPQFNIPGPGIF